MIKGRWFLASVFQWRSVSSTAVPSVSATRAPPINIPTRIKRKPTDLLKALASTIKDDPTGYSPFSIDDPYFAPSKPYEAQNFALSKEMGRRMARYFVAQYPTLFMYDEDEPRLMAFRPIQKPTSESADDEESLNDRIDRLWVKSAIAVYENAIAHNKPISTPTLLKLLELLAYYNNQEPNDVSESTTETWFRSFLAPPHNAPWDDDGVAMKIYNSLPEPKEQRATAAIICGMLKHFAVEKGYELWKLSREIYGEDGRLRDARVYESLIKYGVERLRAVSAERWDLVMEFFKAMAEDGVKPTLQVFNAAFAVLSKGTRWARTKENAKQLLQEMGQLGIAPSMGTYYHIVRIFDRDAKLGSILSSIISHLQHNGSPYVFTDELDGKFFVEAMVGSCTQLHDHELVLRIHRLLKTGHNYLYMADAGEEVKYYRTILMFVSITEDPKTFFERYYHQITPRYFIPDTRVLFNCLESIEVSGAYQYLSTVCTDMITYHHIYRREFLVRFLESVLRAPAHEMAADMLEKLVKMAKDIYEKIESQYELIEQRKALDKKRGIVTEEKPLVDDEGMEGGQVGGVRLEWTADLIATLALIYARGGAPRQAWEVYTRVIPPSDDDLIESRTLSAIPENISTKAHVIGEVPEEHAIEMLDHFVKRKWIKESYAALRVIARGRNQEIIKESVMKIKKNIPLNKVQLSKLETYINQQPTALE